MMSNKTLKEIKKNALKKSKSFFKGDSKTILNLIQQVEYCELKRLSAELWVDTLRDRNEKLMAGLGFYARLQVPKSSYTGEVARNILREVVESDDEFRKITNIQEEATLH